MTEGEKTKPKTSWNDVRANVPWSDIGHSGAGMPTWAHDITQAMIDEGYGLNDIITAIMSSLMWQNRAAKAATAKQEEEARKEEARKKAKRTIPTVGGGEFSVSDYARPSDPMNMEQNRRYARQQLEADINMLTKKLQSQLGGGYVTKQIQRDMARRNELLQRLRNFDQYFDRTWATEMAGAQPAPAPRGHYMGGDIMTDAGPYYPPGGGGSPMPPPVPPPSRPGVPFDNFPLPPSMTPPGYDAPGAIPGNNPPAGYPADLPYGNYPGYGRPPPRPGMIPYGNDAKFSPPRPAGDNAYADPATPAGRQNYFQQFFRQGKKRGQLSPFNPYSSPTM